MALRPGDRWVNPKDTLWEVAESETFGGNLVRGLSGPESLGARISTKRFYSFLDRAI
jgi:hypothetical protein